MAGWRDGCPPTCVRMPMIGLSFKISSERFLLASMVARDGSLHTRARP